MAGTLIYKRNVISGAPAVVDNVTGGDMRPVTSNAVNSALNNALTNQLHIVEMGSTDKGYYRKWSNGFIEQWGKTIANQEENFFPIAFTREVIYIEPQQSNFNGSSSIIFATDILLDRARILIKWTADNSISQLNSPTNYYVCGY